MLASQMLRAPAPFRPARASRNVVVTVQAQERLRLSNLGPSKGSRHKEARKGRGYAAGQGGTCGFGNRGQKSRSGPGVRPGFEGGQMPLYRRLPKLRGIAGGMGAGVPDFVVVNLGELEQAFEAGAEVTKQAVAEKVYAISGAEAKLPLKVLGNGQLTKALTIKAGAVSETAKAAIEAAGGKVEIVEGPKKWTRKAHKAAVEAAGGEEAYKKERLAKKVARLTEKGLLNKKRLAKASKPKKAAPAAAKGKGKA